LEIKKRLNSQVTDDVIYKLILDFLPIYTEYERVPNQFFHMQMTN
jgi:hypothetical protein